MSDHVFKIIIFALLAGCGVDLKQDSSLAVAKISSFVVRSTHSKVPGSLSPFKLSMPLGNIAHFKDRWRWISNKIVPDWKKLDSNNRELVLKKLNEAVLTKKEVCK